MDLIFRFIFNNFDFIFQSPTKTILRISRRFFLIVYSLICWILNFLEYFLKQF
jgi:hypothetical protein